MMSNSLQDKIRFALEPENPGLLSEYLSHHAVRNDMTKTKHQQVLEEQFRLLLDTMADECLPVHWRQQCLDHIYMPLSALWRISDTEKNRTQVRQLFSELRIIGNYFTAGLST